MQNKLFFQPQTRQLYPPTRGGLSIYCRRDVSVGGETSQQPHCLRQAVIADLRGEKLGIGGLKPHSHSQGAEHCLQHQQHFSLAHWQKHMVKPSHS